MTDGSKAQSWWQTLPGVLTAVVGIITAITGLVGVLYQAGFFQHRQQEPIPASSAPITAPPTSHGIASEKDAQPASGASPRATQLPSKSVNLLAPENGGHVIVASGDAWVGTIDGKEGLNQINYGLDSQAQAVYAFKDEKPATIDTFTVLISGTGDNNVKEFELFVGNDSPTGSFESLGKFKTQNVKLFKTPYQEFKLPKITAKYLKIKLLSTYGSRHPTLEEVQLFGHMEKK
jgi:hypothetical protein